ncbi:hypothetical protein [Virgibacillus ihumii]|uniref:hypothetical protein n=1 Tax=Virgibacillus ihumii TaxID=2686091 RepID=UPI00157C88E8|nr:hypothetical protein [Virgibacillus ihumii]
MSNWPYIIYAIILGVLSFITGEIVTFVMLGFILITLNNINTNLKRIHQKLPGKQGAGADQGGNVHGNN